MSNDFIISGSKINFSLQLLLKTFETEVNHLLDMAEIEVLKLMQQGYTEAQARNQVMRMIQNNEGFAKAFWNRQNRLINELENKLVALPVQEYAEQNPEGKYKWVLGEVITHHCGDCLRLSKMEPRTLKEWQSMDTGLPRQGKTQCSFGCKCMLKPTKSTKETQPIMNDNAKLSRLKNPVSNALTYNGSATGKEEYINLMKNVMDEIDRIHDDGKLINIPLTNRYNKRSWGHFMTARRRGPYGPIGQAIPKEININPSGHHKNLTLAHELGHYIDYFGLGENPGYSATSKTLMSAWKKAVYNSKAYINLKQELTQRQAAYLPTSHHRYLLKHDELWARSYAQYIAEKSGNKNLLKDLQIVQNESIKSQWESDDFKEIMKAIDDIFKEMGWLL